MWSVIVHEIGLCRSDVHPVAMDCVGMPISATLRDDATTVMRS